MFTCIDMHSIHSGYWNIDLYITYNLFNDAVCQTSEGRMISE
jgi:hypothetical protein